MSVLVAKRAVKRTAGIASVLLRGTTGPRPDPSVCILVYHRVSRARVSEPRLDDWNVHPEMLDKQIAALVEHADLVWAHELPALLAGHEARRRPLACLTFDDGFQNFHDEALPILERYGAKATLFVVTAYIGQPAPMPFDRWGGRHAADAPASAWRAIDWPSIERCLRSGLVEVGGHSHRHRSGLELTATEMADEAGQCRDVLTARLGRERIASYAYPYGSSRLGHVTPAYVAAVADAGFVTSMTTDLGLATAASRPLELPRVEVYTTDTPAVVRAKVSGSLAPFRVTDHLRRARR
ncbi:MAG: polysaccharide deacetylase family protein [Acidobacteria bacterium]|nr:polysaccharide deacetylase family protein [Acidobacteriota bacterium]